MNYCVSARQPASVLKKADEIMVDYNDVNIMYDFIDKYPSKKFIIRIPKDQLADFTMLSAFSSKVNLTICLEDLRTYPECVKADLPFYWAYEITTYDELNCINAIGACEFLVSGPLYFDLKEVSKRGKKIRLIANLCYDGFIPHANGINGTYVRPEDIPKYEEYVSTLEFKTDSLKKEATLFDIYASQEWKGNLNLLLTNFNFDVDNRGIPDEFADARMQCRQDCQRAGKCRFCYSAMNFCRVIDKNKRQWVLENS